jgi:RNA polymerase sigma factor (sigma-70 family)
MRLGADGQIMEFDTLSSPNDQVSGNAPEPLPARCSFCNKAVKDGGFLVEGPQREELGRAYICGDCIELCSVILDQQEQKRKSSEDKAEEGMISASSLEALNQTLDQVLTVLNDTERAVVKLRYGLGYGYRNTFEDVGRMLEMSPEQVRSIEDEAVKKLKP